MIVRSFLKWYQTANVQGRVEAVEAMADAYLGEQLGASSPAEVEAALTLVLDDAAPAVRRALAWKLALNDKAPRHLLIGLAHDRAEVSSLILARSPQLRDADLVDCARTGASLNHLAIAMRHEVSAVVSATLAEVAAGDVLVALCRNPGAQIPQESFAVMVRRHPEDGALREALAERDDLPSAVRQSLVATLSSHLMSFVGATGLMEQGRAQRLIGDTREMVTVQLALEAPDLGPFVEHLRQTGQLTPSLLLRGVLCGDVTLLGAALVALSDMAPKRVAGILKSRGPALRAVYNKAGLQADLFPAFEAGIVAIRTLKLETVGQPRLSRPVIQSVLAACLMQDEAVMRPVLAMLRRFDAEAAREDARILTAGLLEQEAPATFEAHVAPAIDLDSFAEALKLEDHPPEDLSPVEQVVFAEEVAPAAAPGVLPNWRDLVASTEIFIPTVEEAVAEEAGDSARREVAGDQEVYDDETYDDETYHSELDDLFAAAFGEQEKPAPSTGSLQVIERLEDQLDEAFFANWDIRRQAA